jgi:hypothetical protein
MDIDTVATLAGRLIAIPRVIRAGERHGQSADAEAWQIATALGDIDDSATELFRELVPRLLQTDPSGEEADDLLHQIGEAYRHILYHILDTKVFDYIDIAPPDR